MMWWMCCHVFHIVDIAMLWTNEVAGQMGERVDNDDDSEVVAMLLYLLRCHCRCVVNRCNAMDGVAGQMGESDGE